MSQVIERLSAVFAPDVVAAYLFGTLVPNLIVGGVTFLGFYLLWRLLRRAMRAVFSRSQIDVTAQRFVETVVRYVVLTIGVISALGQVGINTGSILTSLGVAGLTIGFAAKDALSNVISGLFIFWDRPFVIEDLVEINGQYGRVAEITMRSTRVVTPDGRMLAIPNSEVVNSTVASYTNFPHLRLDIDVTVGVNEDLSRVRSLLLQCVEGVDGFLDSPAPEMGVTALNDYNVAVQLRVWLRDEREHVSARLALREKVYGVLTEAGVDMPFETLTIRPLDVRQLPAA